MAVQVASYEFTTLTCIPGVVRYRGAKIQLLDLPGIIEGAKDGKGRGRQVRLPHSSQGADYHMEHAVPCPLTSGVARSVRVGKPYCTHGLVGGFAPRLSLRIVPTVPLYSCLCGTDCYTCFQRWFPCLPKRVSLSDLQVISTARTCNLILIVLDCLKPISHKKLIEHELEGFGIRLNKKPPAITFRKKDKGGLNFTTTISNPKLDLDSAPLLAVLLTSLQAALADLWGAHSVGPTHTTTIISHGNARLLCSLLLSWTRLAQTLRG